MLINTLTIAHDRYYLAEGEVEHLRTDVVAAVVHGGGLVEVVAIGGRHTSVLVSPGLPLSFTVGEVDEGAGDRMDDGVDEAEWFGFDSGVYY